MYKLIKRLFDFISALVLLIIISPLFVILAIFVCIDMGWPIFFTQERSGRNMIPFKLVKFRTMNNNKDACGNLLPDKMRVSRFGKWLRSSSMDELPELFNILKGDMSVIGPRPLPVKYNDYFTEYEKSRFSVRSGLITPDSIDENPIVSWNKQFDYEAYYAHNISLMLDLKIFIGVFRILIKRRHEDYGGFERVPLDVEREKLIN